MLVLRTLCYAAAFGGTFFMLLPWLICTRLPADPSSLGVWRWLGFIPLALGLAVVAWVAATFTTAGQGTTAPFDPPRKLVALGLYRYTRNPMYLGGLAILAGEVLLCGSPPLLGYLALVALAAQLFIVYYEEPALTRRFGPAYTQYAARTPRWLAFRRRQL